MLIEPGHMMPTAKPHTMHPTKLTSGTEERDAVR
jgi:hypothetical protein